jgi:hypothetical protein
VSNYVEAFWNRLQHESSGTFVVVPEERFRPQLQPYAELGKNVLSIGPSADWSKQQAASIRMLVEEGPSRCVWLVVKPRTELVSDIAAAYDDITPLADLLAEVPYQFDRSALEAALLASSEGFVFCPGAEEPIILVPGAELHA